MNSDRKKWVAIITEKHALLLGYIAAAVTILLFQHAWEIFVE